MKNKLNVLNVLLSLGSVAATLTSTSAFADRCACTTIGTLGTFLVHDYDTNENLTEENYYLNTCNRQLQAIPQCQMNTLPHQPTQHISTEDEVLNQNPVMARLREEFKAAADLNDSLVLSKKWNNCREYAATAGNLSVAQYEKNFEWSFKKYDSLYTGHDVSFVLRNGELLVTTSDSETASVVVYSAKVLSDDTLIFETSTNAPGDIKFGSVDAQQASAGLKPNGEIVVSAVGKYASSLKARVFTYGICELERP